MVATFLRDVLKRNNVDNKGGKLISTINCVVKRDERPAGSKNWLNAFWDGKQMIYGQVTYNGRLRSLAASLDVVAHELFHGVTAATARLVYQGEPGALNESYSDIFGIFVSNLAEPDIGKWNWLIGDGISNSLEALRDMRDPTRFGHPKLMKNYKKSANTLAGDFGGVHINSGIHNFAAYNVMTAQNGGKFLFKPSELAAMFYVALTQQLSRQSTFSDSRRAVVLTARSLFRALPQTQIDHAHAPSRRASTRPGSNNDARVVQPLVPAKAGTQGQELDARVRGHERERLQFLALSTSCPLLIHGIIARSFAPTCSIGCAAQLGAHRLERGLVDAGSPASSRLRSGRTGCRRARASSRPWSRR